jgi:hypothetical protein
LRSDLFWLEIGKSILHVRNESSPSPFTSNSYNL